MTRVFVVLNPIAGQSNPEEIRSHLSDQIAAHGWESTIYQTNGDESDRTRLEEAVASNYDLFIAAGGDGTVALTATALIGTGIPLSILPTGTGNGVARAAGIPLDWREATGLIFGEHQQYEFDAMQVAGQYFLLHLGVGLSGVALRQIDLESKRRLGRLYYPFASLRALFGYQPHRFKLTIDAEDHTFKGTEVFIINSASMGDPFVRWSDSIKPTDGTLDVFLVRARTLTDFLRLAWNVVLGRQRLDPKVTYLLAHESIDVRTDPTLPLQGDGEFVTEAPFSVQLVEEAIKIIGPAQSAQM